MATDEKGDAHYSSRDPSQVHVTTTPDDKSKKLKRCCYIVVALIVLVIIMIVVIAVIAWLLVDVSSKETLEPTMTPSPVLPRGTFVSFASENPLGSGSGMLFGNPDEHPRGLIVMAEWWGMNPQIQRMAARMSRDGGFTTLVIDFYRGEVPIDREQASHIRTGLNWSGVIMDVSAATKYLKDRGCRAVGITGFCMGGALCLAAAANSTGLAAAAPFYGVPSADLVDLTSIKIPIQGHYGELDTSGAANPQSVSTMKTALVAAGVDIEVYMYDAGHAFANEEGQRYNKEAAELALKRMFQFMHTNV